MGVGDNSRIALDLRNTSDSRMTPGHVTPRDLKTSVLYTQVYRTLSILYTQV